MKVIVAHIGKQHSYKTAEAFYKEGVLLKYITTVYDKSPSLTNVLKIFLYGKTRKKCKSRRTDNLPDKYINQYCEFWGLLRLFISRIPILKNYQLYFDNRLMNRFGEKVAKYAIKNEVDAVIMYDTNSNKCWEILKNEAPHIKRILDVSIASRLFMKENFIKDIEITNDYNLMIEQKHLWIKSNLDRYKKEFEDSEFFLAASKMVKKSLMHSGVSENKIAIVPYGVDSNQFQYVKKTKIKNPLKLIYVGEISYRKGIHHLLKVIASMPLDEVELNLCGMYDNSSELYKAYKDCANINFQGFVTRDILALNYQLNDVFVFATLGEGYGLVILEALSCGLPCIVSDLSGGNDAIQNGYNGFVFKAGDDHDLKSRIQWFIDNRNALPQMSKNSKESSRFYTWERYYSGVCDAIKEIVLG